MDEPARILSIEDEDTLRRTIVAYLEDSGFDMLEAENGRVGLEVFNREHPDLVLCDLRMPEMDGLTVLARIRETSPETPFIVVSGTGDIHDAVEALQLGAWDFITKPIQDMEVLEHSARKALNEARLIRENREYREHLIETNRRLRESLDALEEDENAARRVQFQLLPKPVVKGGGFEFSFHLQPSATLSGDFVDYFQIDDTHWGFYIADVSGHGASSAFITVLLKSMMTHLLDQYRQSENEKILHSDQVLKRLSEHIADQDLGKYLTMFYAVLDTAGNTMTYSNGGHFPRPVLFDGETSRYLEEKNLPVGLFKTAEYTATAIDIPARFALAMFSDGIFEVIEAEDTKDQQEFLRALLDSNDITMEDLIEELRLDSVVDPPDDVTVLLVRKPG